MDENAICPQNLGRSPNYISDGKIMQPNSKIALIAVLTISVCSLVLITHWPALSAQAVSFDDSQYFIDNFLVRDPSWESAKRFLTEVFEPSTVKGYYQPLTMISLMLDYAIGGHTENLTPFHRTSLLLHIANTAMIIVLLYQLFGNVWAAAGIGLLFGVHPLTVEVIAWTSERKTLLAAFFMLWSLILYVRFTRRNNFKIYIGCVVMYVLALMSKPTSTPLPVMMLLMDYWPLRRLKWQTVLEKLPLFVIGGVSAVITYISQSRAGSVVTAEPYGPIQVLLVVCHNIIFYLFKMIWPVNLSSHYAFPKPFGLSEPTVIIGVVGTFILILLLLISLRRTRAALTGWLIFFVMVFPTMQVYRFSDVIAADKFIYLPSIGILMILTSFLVWICSADDTRRHTKKYVILAFIVILPAGAESFASRQYLSKWKDTVSLFRHMIRVTPKAIPPRNCLGVALRKRGEVEQAIECFTEMLKIDPNNFNAHVNIGVALASKGKLDEAASCYKEAIRLSPANAGIYRNLAIVLAAQGRIDEAVVVYREGLEHKPNHPEYLYDGLGLLLFQQGKTDEAISCFSEAIHLSPTTAGIYKNYGKMLAVQGRIDEAIVVYRRGLESKPDHPEYLHKELGLLLFQQGKIDEAIRELQVSVKLIPDSMAYNSLGGALASKGKLDEAIECYRKTVQLDPKNAEAYYNLANILLLQGKLEQAVGEYEKAIHVNPKYAKAYNNLGVAFLHQNQTDEAIRYFTEAVRVEPSNIDAHYNLAVAMTQQNRLEEAAGEYLRVLQLQPQDIDARCILAEILTKQGKIEEAAAQYQEVLKMDPNHPRARESLKNIGAQISN
jgi:tetratricopeptide (TPR) repeat protein